jgi:transposase
VIAAEQVAEIRRLFFAEHWKMGTIASEMRLSWETVRLVVNTERFNRPGVVRKYLTDPYVDFIKQTLEKHPRLRATRIFEMLRQRGYTGGVQAVRRTVSRLRPSTRPAFLRLSVLPGEEGQVDWAHFGKVRVGGAERALSCFVLVLSHSRAMYLEFFFDQTVSSFLEAHVRAFADLGIPRTLLYDNLRSAVLERRGTAIHLHPRLLELAAHYHVQPRFCAVARANEKGRVERAIQYVRHSFFAARPFTNLADFNHKALAWREQIAHERRWPGGDYWTVRQAYADERPRLLPQPVHPFPTEYVTAIHTQKTPFVRFDGNDYSVPHTAVGKSLTLAASSTTVRVMDGTLEIARHARSFDRHIRVENPAHLKALLAQKKAAGGATRLSALISVLPAAEPFLQAAVARGESERIQAEKLARFVTDYGPELVQKALAEAVDRGTPNASSVAFLLQRLCRSQKARPPLSVSIPSRPELVDVVIAPHDPARYDALHQSGKRDDD